MADNVRNCVWIVKSCEDGRIRIRHTTTGNEDVFTWSGPQLEVGLKIDLGGDRTMMLGEALRAYEVSLAKPKYPFVIDSQVLTSDGRRGFVKAIMNHISGDEVQIQFLECASWYPIRDVRPYEAKFAVGDRVRVICGCAKKAIACAHEGLTAVVSHVFMPPKLDETQDYMLEFDDANVNKLDRGAFGDNLLERSESAVINVEEPARASSEATEEPALAGIILCLRCGGPAGYLGIRCERSGGCRLGPPEPRIMPADPRGVSVMDCDVFRSSVQNGSSSEIGWYAAGSGSSMAGRRIAAGPFATQELAVAAWKAVHQ